MKVSSLFIAIFALAMLMIPMIALSFEPASPAAQTEVRAPAAQASSEPLQPAGEAEEEDAWEVVAEAEVEAGAVSHNGISSFDILDQSTGRVVTVSLRDFVRGAVAAEMPVSFHPEALKAQAVAAHTYALHNHYLQQQNPDPSLKGADFAADPSNMLVYITEETAREFYGENAELHWDKICQAADSVLNYVLEYEDEPIIAAYHAISAGRTEDSGNIWSTSVPYLQPTESGGDLLAPDFETTVLLARSAVKDALLTAYPDAQLPDDPQKWFTNIKRSDSGYITSAEIGGVAVHGKDIRTLFELRSHNIDIEYQADLERFAFYVYGYGHGVGLSQYGADFMARQGASFDEILLTYYSGVTLKETGQL